MKPAAVRLPAQDTRASAAEFTSVNGGARSFDSGSSGGQGPLRVEIQTQNPDIRIIWFAPNTKQASSTN